VVEFLKNTFHAADLRRFNTPKGKIMHAEVRIGDTVEMIVEASARYPSFPVGCTFMCRMWRPSTRKPPKRARFQFKNPCAGKAIRIVAVASKTLREIPGGSLPKLLQDAHLRGPFILT
jgi:hypothetical protein